jgi:Dolichyl-phosphate-mannose-protein mannosyltransferase
VPFVFYKIRQFVIHPALWCALAVALCILASGPRLEMGFGDDFSYIWTARTMADTGHFVYNGWATAMLGWQIYLGALFIKLFGFSFTAVRASSVLVGMATGALLQHLFVRVGVNEWNATLASLTLAVSPLFLPFTFCFMTDVPGFFAILVCLYGCIRAVQANSDRAAIGWLIFAAFSNAIGGTARQIAWLGVLLMVPSTAWVMRRRRGALVVAAALWILSAAFIAGCMYWFKRQPYSVAEPLLVQPYPGEPILFHMHYLSHKYLAILLFSLPILIAFAARYPVKERWARIQAGAVFITVVGTGGFCAAIWPAKFRTASQFLLAPFSDGEITTKGIEIMGFSGNRPDVLPISVQIVLSVLTFSAFLAFLLSLLNASRLEKPADADTGGQISNRTLLTVLGPFTAGYLILQVTRAAVFERYFIPLLFVFLIFLLRFYQTRIASRLPVLTVIFVALFGAYGVVTLHDFLAGFRAGLEAADELRAAGIERNEIRANAEYDGWTQIELTGHLAPKKRLHPPPPCVYFWESDDPAIHAHYQLSYDLTCFPESEFSPVEYTTWLAPHHQKIYILRRPE